MTNMKNECNKKENQERELLRQKGQFWTPEWIAEVMVSYVTRDGINEIFDPAVGAGAFFLASYKISKELNRKFNLKGTEIDSKVLEEAKLNGVLDKDIKNIEITDFVLKPPKNSFKAIVANPPYIRHHRIENGVKDKLRAFTLNVMGKQLDGRTGYHIYFLLRALQLLEKNGRLAFIMSADTCEGVFANSLWNWIAREYCLEAVVVFSPEATPFPTVDTNPLIIMIKNSKPKEYFLWTKCIKAQTPELKEWISSKFLKTGSHIKVYLRKLKEGIETGLSRQYKGKTSNLPRLVDYARVIRGIATGANDFFFLNIDQVSTLEIPDKYLISAIGRTRDVEGDEITNETIKKLEEKGRPTKLLSLDNIPLEKLPRKLIEYLKQGEKMGINERALIRSRRPWYKMEKRLPPPILFSYLGRRNTRFIRNYLDLVPLTGFLCIYPNKNDPTYIEKLWKVLQHPETISNLSLVAKSYGAGALKAEPRALEKLPLSAHVLSEQGLLIRQKEKQLEFSVGSEKKLALADSNNGVYFITICAQQRECLFGEIVDNDMRINEYGIIAQNEWIKSPNIRNEIKLDEYVVMPNHIHGIVWFDNSVGANGRSPLHRTNMGSKTLSSFVAGYKSTVTQQINGLRLLQGVPVWQRNFYEHIIRNERELNIIREYIIKNPLQWQSDRNNPNRVDNGKQQGQLEEYIYGKTR